MAPPPSVNRRIIEALLDAEFTRAQDRRLVLVHGRYEESSPAEFARELGGRKRRIRVTDQQSVLGIVDAWQRHQAEHPEGADVLVVTTGVDDSQLGWDLRGYAVGRATRTVDRAEIVKQRFGATDIDARIRREAWLVDALLDAEPAGGWRRSGSVLTRDAAVRALIGARLGTEDFDEGTLDVGALLTWTRSPAGPGRFAALPDSERAGLITWLTETVGDTAPVLMGLASSGQAADAMALGVIGAVIRQPEASTESAAYGGLLGMVRSRPHSFAHSSRPSRARLSDGSPSPNPVGHTVMTHGNSCST